MFTPPKKMTAKERIIDLSTWFNTSDVAEIVGTTVAYVKKVLSENKHAAKSIERVNPPALTIKNYVAAHRMGITRKNDLAAFFGVNRKTINRFENSRGTQQHLAHYMELHVNGYDLNEVLQRLTSIHETLVIFEPESDITQKVTQAIELLTAVPKKGNSHKC